MDHVEAADATSLHRSIPATQAQCGSAAHGFPGHFETANHFLCCSACCAQDDDFDVALQASTGARAGTQAQVCCGAQGMKPRIFSVAHEFSWMPIHMPSTVRETHFERIADAHCHAHLDADEHASEHFNELKVRSIA
jgi:hypothetical protein